MPRAAIVGSGLTGRAWALVFARAGWKVSMTDPSPTVKDALPVALAQDCSLLADYGLAEKSEPILARISIVSSLVEAVSD